MASKKKQKGMVFHQEGAATPAATTAVGRPPSRFVAPKPGKVSEGRTEASVRRGGGQKHLDSLNPQSDALSPESICRGIKVTLENHSMWNEFFRCGTEMILTKQGSRMFPYCRFRISGLQPSRKYCLIMDVQPLDNSHYRWTGKSWQAAGKAARHIKSPPFAHPESPATGQHWMQSPVSFYKMKLTNNVSDQEGNIILHPMHRYLPRLHVVQIDKAAKDVKLNDPGVVTFTFPQTEFMAVASYQNARFVQLKVNYNPFAKGLKEDSSSSWTMKLKANTAIPLRKDGGSVASEQRPVKESLKSLLANHKPRSLKAADSKPSAPGDIQKTSTPYKGQLAPKAPGESLGTVSRPAQKLFSELIREAHVSLQRCNLEQLGINHSTSLKVEQTNTKNSSLKGKGPHAAQKDGASIKASLRKSETIRKRKVKEDRQLSNSLNCKDNARIGSSSAPEGSRNTSEDSDHQHNPDAPLEVAVKQHKRPARLPLPALALFLKQHSKKTKNKSDSPTPAAPSECLSKSPSSAAASACLPSEGTTSATEPSKDLKGDTKQPDISASGCTSPHAGKEILNVIGQIVETASQLPGSDIATDPLRPRTDDFMAPISKISGPEPEVLDGTPVLPHSDQPFIALVASSTIATSSSPAIVPPPLDTVLPAPQTPPESSTLPLDSPTLKSSLPDPECSSFGFEPLSPASSPEPLPPLPVSIALELDSTTSEAPHAAGSPEDLQEADDSSVFKWHTVLPPPESFVDTSFTTFQSPTQTLCLTSVTPPLLPSQTPVDPEPQSQNNSTPTATADPPPSFQESEQSLPFPAELSPLALQLPLSPTFSSLDGDGLSPTPSLADLVQFLSTDVDLGMGVEFSNTEAVASPCQPTTETHEHSLQVHPAPTSKSCKRKKKVWQRKHGKTERNQEVDDATYRSMQPNLEEVEEQLFISFTSKEALKLHVGESSDRPAQQPQMTPEDQGTSGAPENQDRMDKNEEQSLNFSTSKPAAESLEQTITSFQNILLKDLKLMKHRQVIHPVLQEVGLKMTLLDPTLAIDLQYLGVHLPIPPPGTSVEPLPMSQGVSAVFVSRTGKTTDVTQIKGWRAKFTQSEAPPTPADSRPEAGSSSEPQKKNLSAFCSDMLDEYLENEGKLIDERAASFSQPPVEPLVYELPTRSTSYVRTLDNIRKKQSADSPASDLISGFIPPSKRPRLKERKAGQRAERKHKGPKQNKLKPEPVMGPEPSPAEYQQPAVHTAAVLPSDPVPDPKPIKRRRKFKPRTLSQTLSPSRATVPPPGMSQDLAPLESDSELGPNGGQREDTGRMRRPPMTRALLKQKNMEDSVVWEGRPRTSITEERACIALTSLFTQTGFVSENPTVPIQLIRRRAPTCLNDFCRLGCVCSGLSYSSRISHCGRPACMFGCSCLKQKVVFLKNLDGSDSSPSPCHRNNKKRRRRMKMAYILKEADSVSQPAERVRTLWRRNQWGSDPEPVHIPEAGTTKVRQKRSSCARVRGYTKKLQKRREAIKDATSKAGRLKYQTQKNPKKTKKALRPPPDGALQAPPSGTPLTEAPPSPPTEPVPKPSKRLFIMTDFKWESEADWSHMVTELCEAMDQERLDQPFWIRNYLICPTGQSLEGADHCIQYHVKISRPKGRPGGRATPVKPAAEHKQVSKKAEPPKDGNQQVMEEVGPLKKSQEELGEAEPLEDWQREVEEGDIKEEEGFMGHQVDNEKEGGGEEVTSEEEKRVSMALPFLTGISPAGFLLANRKQPGGTDQLIQVNGKLYPLAKIQLGKMGALHPANRLAAYLTGRVGSNRQQQPPLRPASSSCNPTLSSGAKPQTVSSASSLLSGLATGAVSTATFSTTAAVSTTAVTATTVTARTPPNPTSNQKAATPPAHLTSLTDSVSSSSVVPPINPSLSVAPPRGPRVLLIQVPPPRGSVPVVTPRLPAPVATPRLPAPISSSGRMLLQPVQMASGAQFYRRPDGKLVQLVPLSQLKPMTHAPPGERASSSSSSSSLLSAAAVTARQQTSLSTPLNPGLLSQKGTCTFRILPCNSSKDPIVVTCAKAPPKTPTKGVSSPGSCTILQTCTSNTPTAPAKRVSIKASLVQGAEQGVNRVTPSVVPPGPGGVVVQLASPQTSPSIQTPAETTRRPQPLAGSEVRPAPPPHTTASRIHPKPELTQDLADLDILCVDDDTELIPKEKQPIQVTSSSETENSSDFRESESEDEKQPISKNWRILHSTLERMRRERLHQLFTGLRRTVGVTQDMSKVFTLKKAVELIQELRRTQSHLKRKKRRLMKKRDEYLWKISLSADAGRPKSMEVVDLLEEEAAIISSNEERVVISDVDVEDEGRAAPVEKSRLARKKRSSQMKEETRTRSISSTLAALQSAMNRSDSPQDLLIKKAQQEIQTLQTQMEDLKSLKTRLMKQDISSRSGKSKQRTLRKVQHLSFKQRDRHQTPDDHLAWGVASIPPPAGGVASGAGDTVDDVITSSDQENTTQAPPAPVSAPPTLAPVQVPPKELVSLVSQNAPVQRERPRTIPNILSRSKNQVPPLSVRPMTAEGEPSSFQALIPTDVLSLVGAALPGQPVLTMNPVTVGSTVLQPTSSPGLASVTLNIPALTNQQIHLTSLPHPPTGKSFSSTAPPTLTNLRASSLSGVLQLVQTNTPLAPPQRHQLLPTPPQVDSAGSHQSSDRITNQEQAPPLSKTRSAASPSPSAECRSEAGPSAPENESLTSLLNELVFLNQEAGEQEDSAVVGGAEEQGHAHSPWMLQLDSDSDIEEAGPNVEIETMQSGMQPESNSATGGVLAPPPLLQMKMGGAKAVIPSSTDGDTIAGRGGGGRRDGGVAWRPMPRLVPLGLRGHAPS